MLILHIEHAVHDFETWKRTFDAYGEHRARGGVRTYRVSRPVDDPRYVVIDLEFDDTASAQAFLAMLRGLWERAVGTLIEAPRAHVAQTVEQRTLNTSPAAAESR